MWYTLLQTSSSCSQKNARINSSFDASAAHSVYRGLFQRNKIATNKRAFSWGAALRYEDVHRLTESLPFFRISRLCSHFSFCVSPTFTPNFSTCRPTKRPKRKKEKPLDNVFYFYVQTRTTSALNAHRTIPFTCYTCGNWTEVNKNGKKKKKKTLKLHHPFCSTVKRKSAEHVHTTMNDSMTSAIKSTTNTTQLLAIKCMIMFYVTTASQSFPLPISHARRRAMECHGVK